jgi:hypothetical protein
MVLAEPEFPGKKIPSDLQTLIDNGDIEIIWYPRNIRSHKKLIPTLKKYPDNPILVTDDDIRREKTWVEMFVKDHESHPDDIIAGAYSFFFNSRLELTRFNDMKGKHSGGKNHIPSLVFNFTRPANGCAGTLYPAHTFTDPRFFDENLMMRISPTSDESWQFCFNIIADKTFRQTSVVRDHSVNVIPGTQEMSTALYRANSTKYPIIFKELMKEFPEFRKKLRERQKRFIISLTSYPARYPKLPLVLDSLLNQTIKAEKIVLTLTKEESSKLTPELRKYIDSGKVELLIANEDLRPHNKYFHAMQKYPAHAIITVDDDVIYAKTMAESLLKGYWDHPNCVVARRVHRKRRDRSGKLLPYSRWGYECKTVRTPSMELFATGVGGVLYPPNILDISDKDLPMIREIIGADDVFLNHIETKKKIKVLYVKDASDKPLNDEKTQAQALHKTNCAGGANDRYIKKLEGKPSAPKNGAKKTGEKIAEKKPAKNAALPKKIMTINVRKSRPATKSWSTFFGL